MGIFFGDWSSPQQSVVEPRRNIRLSWVWYQDPNNTENEDPLQYFKLMWKPATIKGWTNPSIKHVYLEPGTSNYTIPPYTFTLDSAWVWRIEAWVVDKDYDPEVPPGDGVPTANPFVTSQSTCIVDTSGYVLGGNLRFGSSVASGQKNFGTVGQQIQGFSLVPSDPGQYEMRVKVQNGFTWSAWSTLATVVQYDTRKFVKKSGSMVAVPAWRRTSDSWTRIKR